MSHSEDFSSISPSAKSLLLLKANTNIPFAREIAGLMSGPDVFDVHEAEQDFIYWLRVMHFESRYRSIEQLLADVQPRQVLELSSGYSLRGLAYCMQDANLHYIDTDLPEVIALKHRLLRSLSLPAPVKGRFEMNALNIMDADALNAVLAKFEDGPVTLVNEGLLMYLDKKEKEQVCRNIHACLQSRGGYWITADIYIKRSENTRAAIPQSKGEVSFFEQHQIESNKFDSTEDAAAFFAAQGFEMVKEADVDFRRLSAFPELLKVLPEAFRNSDNPPPKIQSTWMLKAI